MESTGGDLAKPPTPKLNQQLFLLYKRVRTYSNLYRLVQCLQCLHECAGLAEYQCMASACQALKSLLSLSFPFLQATIHCEPRSTAVRSRFSTASTGSTNNGCRSPFELSVSTREPTFVLDNSGQMFSVNTCQLHCNLDSTHAFPLSSPHGVTAISPPAA